MSSKRRGGKGFEEIELLFLSRSKFISSEFVDRDNDEASREFEKRSAAEEEWGSLQEHYQRRLNREELV